MRNQVKSYVQGPVTPVWGEEGSKPARQFAGLFAGYRLSGIPEYCTAAKIANTRPGKLNTNTVLRTREITTPHVPSLPEHIWRTKCKGTRNSIPVKNG